MYLYNITFNIVESAELKWLDWMQKTHIPAMMATNKFTSAMLIQVAVQEEMGGVTYTTQYVCESAEKLKDFYRLHAPSLNSEITRVFSNQVVLFGTELKVVKKFVASKKHS